MMRVPLFFIFLSIHSCLSFEFFGPHFLMVHNTMELPLLIRRSYLCEGKKYFCEWKGSHKKILAELEKDVTPLETICMTEYQGRIYYHTHQHDSVDKQIFVYFFGEKNGLIVFSETLFLVAITEDNNDDHIQKARKRLMETPLYTKQRDILFLRTGIPSIGIHIAIRRLERRFPSFYRACLDSMNVKLPLEQRIIEK